MKNNFLGYTLVFFCLVFFVAGCVSVPKREIVQPGGIYHVVERGQTLYRIAKTYGVDLNRLMQANKITDPTKIEVGQKIFIPHVSAPLTIEPYRPMDLALVRRIVGPPYYTSRWRSITLHHSATHEGSAACFDRNHRARRMGGLFYHFVIGNGTYSGDGQIEVGWRWKKQAQVNRPYDIQICLVGNFDKEAVTPAQFDSLVKLIAVLMEQYNIPIQNIRQHRDIPGRITRCPGVNFPFARLIYELKKR